MIKNEIVRLEHIEMKSKGAAVLSDFKLNILEGEFVILYGNFGCGRKEVAELLMGQNTALAGRIYINEEPLDIREPIKPDKLGIFAVSDHTGLVLGMSVAENIFLSWKQNMFSFTLPRRILYRETEHILNMMGVGIPPEKLAGQISKIDRQIVKLAKAYCRKARLVIINDMADIYTPAERDKLFSAIRFLQSKGTSILWITGKCMNTIKYMDKLVVMHHGKNVRTFFDTPEDKEILSKMVNQTSHTRQADWIGKKKDDELFRLRIREGQSKEPIFIAKGECVGIIFENTGELNAFLEEILGKRQLQNWYMWINNKFYVPDSYERAVFEGVYELDMIDIQNNLFHNLSVKENLIINSMKRTSKGRLFLNRTFMEFIYAKYREKNKMPPKERIDDCSWKEREGIIFHRLSMNSSKLIVAEEFWAHVDDARWDGMIENIEKCLAEKKSFLFLSVNSSDLKQVCNRIYKIKGKKIEVLKK
ncbi:ATP-binding cassette domain-containing protein [Konateibacter massiliensis]|uniref:ATP-binding cassette domain-containing protein n=1 Tax=Konateibacter massiliensis TaxID=2002841 RepID=UPI000C15922A|nr:ATP-binding cassette domain-containing protein [Konateibacter massiliensis]